MCKKFFSAIEGMSSKTQKNPSSSFINYKASRARRLFQGMFDTAKAEKNAWETLQPQIKHTSKVCPCYDISLQDKQAVFSSLIKKCTFFSTAKTLTPGEHLWNGLLSYLTTTSSPISVRVLPWQALGLNSFCNPYTDKRCNYLARWIQITQFCKHPVSQWRSIKNVWNKILSLASLSLHFQLLTS